MLPRVDRLSGFALALLLAGAACLAVGLLVFDELYEGGFSTQSVGTPAYAALFTAEVDQAVRSWIVAGAALVSIGGAAALALAQFDPRAPSSGPLRRSVRRSAPVVSCLVAGVGMLHVGVLRLPLGFGIDAPPGFADDPSFIDAIEAADLTPPGVEWLVAGTGLMTLGGLVCLFGLVRAWNRRPAI